MTTYAIFTKEKTHDQREIDIYQSQVRATFEGRPLKVLAAGAPQIIEGSAVEGIVIIEFSNTDAAHQWYNSAEYQAIIAHRLNGAKYSVALVEA